MDECTIRAWSWSPGSPAGMLLRRHQDLPSSWGISMIRLHMFLDAGGIADTRPSRWQNSALGACNAKAPPIGLSTLNSMAFGFAVYALPDGLPAYDTRLASGCWSGSAGRGFHPQDSAERFQICFLTSLPPLPSFLAQTRPHESPGLRCVSSFWLGDRMISGDVVNPNDYTPQPAAAALRTEEQACRFLTRSDFAPN